MKVIIVLLSLVMSFATQAQNPVSKLKPLMIGDKVPDLEFTLMNMQKQRVKLSNYKGKLIILDFWATWCGACIGGFLKADSLQKQFGDKIQIILVNTIQTGDTKKKLDDFYSSWMAKTPNFQLPIAINDAVTPLIFKNNGYPHYVWISPERKVIGMTSTRDVNIKNIEKYIRTGNVALAIKDAQFQNYIYFNGKKQFSITDFDNLSFFKKGKIDGIDQLDAFSTAMREDSFVVNRIIAQNTRLIPIYKLALREKEYLFKKNRLRLETSFPNNLIYDSLQGSKAAWEYDNLYTYYLTVKPEDSERIGKIMLDELNRYSPFFVEVQKVRTKCMVLQRKSDKDNFINPGSLKTIKHLFIRLSHLADAIEEAFQFKLPVVDETYYQGKVRILLNSIDNIVELRKGLEQYDLDLVEEERELEMLIIKDNKRINN